MQMRKEMYEYEISPICFLTGREVTLSLRALNEKFALESGHEYSLLVREFGVAQESRYPDSGCTVQIKAKPGEDGALRITHVFRREGMYQISLFNDDATMQITTRYRENKDALGEFRVYALDEDMKGLYPLRGDFHIHSCRSDGKEDPFTVASNYRERGYDFTIISDHGRYYPSLEARKKFRFDENDFSPLTDMLILRGEEVHLPLNDAHYISCDNAFSINALVTPNNNQEYMGDDAQGRSKNGVCPPTMTKDDFKQMIRERAEKIDRPLESERLAAAVMDWTYEKIKEGGGLGIFVHPYWMTTTVQVSEDFTYYIYKRAPFDAFEVLGGENYYQHNGFQTQFYYENKANGITHPVVGSTDSHGSTEMNLKSMICSTIVFAGNNSSESIKEAVKKGLSVAVDTISREYRLVGDFRLVKYASFLMENWYPLHDRLCAAQGTYMREYVQGNPEAEKILLALKDQVPALERKLFEL